MKTISFAESVRTTESAESFSNAYRKDEGIPTYGIYGYKSDLRNVFPLLGYDFDGGTIYANINSAFKNRILKFMDTLHCFYFAYLGEAIGVYDEKNAFPANKRCVLRASEIEKSLLSAKLSFGLEKISITAVTLIKNLVFTKEKMKRISSSRSFGWTWEMSLGDDLEKHLENFRNNDFSSDILIDGIVFMPMLTSKEMKLLKNNDAKLLKSFSQKNPDVPIEQMMKSNSKSKYAFWNGYRITISDLDYQTTPKMSPLENELLNLNSFPISEILFDQSYCDVLVHDEKSYANSLLEIILVQDNEYGWIDEKFLETLLTIFGNFYVSGFVEKFNFVEIYTTLKLIKDIEVVCSMGECENVFITERYLAECFLAACVPESYS